MILFKSRQFFFHKRFSEVYMKGYTSQYPALDWGVEFHFAFSDNSVIFGTLGATPCSVLLEYSWNRTKIPILRIFIFLEHAHLVLSCLFIVLKWKKNKKKIEQIIV